MKLFLLARSLGVGGTERQIATLASALQARGHAVTVVVFYRGGRLAQELADAGIAVRHLGKRGRWDVVGVLFRLVRLVRRHRPDAVYAFLPTPNMAASAAKPFLKGTAVVWGVRSSSADLSRYDPFSALCARIEPRLSRFADLVVANSEAGARHAVARGFPAERTVVVPNGIDTARFRPDAEARHRVRSQWGVSEEETVIGLVARIDPAKGHDTYLEAAAMVAGRRPDVRFVCVGDGPAAERWSLESLGRELGLGPRLVWTGLRADVAGVYNALDVATMPSAFSEGFPNVVGEAMACGTPCVVTDVGDAARVVGPTGVVVPPDDPKALAEGWLTLLAELDGHGERARQRVLRDFTTEQLATRTCAALARLP